MPWHRDLIIAPPPSPRSPAGTPTRALKVEEWKKKHAYVGFVYFPAKGCDLKSFIIINLQKKMHLIYYLLKHEVTNS